MGYAPSMKTKGPIPFPAKRVPHSTLHGLAIWRDNIPGDRGWHVSHAGVTDGAGQPCRSYRSLEDAQRGIDRAREDALHTVPEELAARNPAYLYRLSVMFPEAAHNLQAAFDLVGEACIAEADAEWDEEMDAEPVTPTPLRATKVKVRQGRSQTESAIHPAKSVRGNDKATKPKGIMRMIGPAELPTVTKAEFIYMLGERGIWVSPSQVRYLRYVDGTFWFVMIGGEDHLETEAGCALSWKALSDDGKRVARIFEVYDEKPIEQTPLEDVVPANSKLRLRSVRTPNKG